MKKVLFVISYLDKGGAERALSNITLNFPKEYSIDILVNSDKYIDYEYNANIISMGIDEKPKTGSVFFQLKVLLKRIKRLKKMKKSGEYTACISFLDSANIANILAAGKSCRTIVSVRNSLKKKSAQPQYRYLVNPLIKWLYNKAYKVVACSKGIEKELTDIYGIKPEKVITIENGYDIKRIRELSCEEIENRHLSLMHDKKVIVTTGRMSHQKGQWHLIRAFNKVLEEIPDSILVIAGTGELQEYLISLVKDYGIENKVIFTGYISNPFKYEKCADVFVLPSLYEGFPNALAEALCLGIPCIATDFETGAREILAPEFMDLEEKLTDIKEVSYGIMTPLCSGKEYTSSDELEKEELLLAEAIKKVLLNDTEKEYNSDSRGCDNKILSIEECVGKWMDVIYEERK